MPQIEPTTAPIYTLAEADTLKALETSEKGLDSSEIGARREKFGINSLPRSKGDGPLELFIAQINNPLIYILLISATAAFLLGKPIDGAVVLGVVVINALIGFLQEYRAGKAIEALSAMVAERVTVTRNGERTEIDSKELVPGDIVHLQSGDKVAADLRLLRVKNLRIEEAALTGESVPTEKGVRVAEANASLGDRTNMAFSGTLVTFGQGTGVVTAIGGGTELGRIASMLDNTSKLQTPLTKSMNTIGKILTIAISIVAILLFGLVVIRDFSLVDALLAAIALAVAAIPEGLPAIITIALAIGVRRMAVKQAVIRKLPAVETLGSTTVICSDKTGTLTKNEMTVQGLWTPGASYQLTGIGYEKEGKILLDGVPIEELPPELDHLLKAGVLCSEAKLTEEGSKRSVHGDPTEGALLVSFEKGGGVPKALRAEHERLDIIPFESERQFMASLHQDGQGSTIYMKGAPEVVLKSVTQDSELSQKVAEQISKFAKEGMRVLAFARKTHSSQTELNESDIQGGFEFLGLQAMIDPPREEAIRAIAACHRAGIIVKMITGDHHETASAIARELNITNEHHALTGTKLDEMSQEELEDAAIQVNVFARVSPEHKLRLVTALQKRGHVVAMTGDGVNDAPALKQSNIGVAMGITGTSVSKEAADLVLVDDNFATIKAAIEEGRRIYDNLIKSLAFILPTNLGLALIILTAVAFLPLIGGEALMPILPVQILWINLVASVALALPLAFEAKEPNIMSRQPRSPDAPVFSPFVIWRTVMVAVVMAVGSIALFLYKLNSEGELGQASESLVAQAQTMAVTTVVFFQVFYLQSCRSLNSSIMKIGIFSNPLIYVGVAVILLLQVVFVHLPLMNQLLHSAPLSLQEWGISALVGTLVIPIIALEKLVRQKL